MNTEIGRVPCTRYTTLRRALLRKWSRCEVQDRKELLTDVQRLVNIYTDSCRSSRVKISAEETTRTLFLVLWQLTPPYFERVVEDGEAVWIVQHTTRTYDFRQLSNNSK